MPPAAGQAAAAPTRFAREEVGALDPAESVMPLPTALAVGCRLCARRNRHARRAAVVGKVGKALLSPQASEAVESAGACWALSDGDMVPSRRRRIGGGITAPQARGMPASSHRLPARARSRAKWSQIKEIHHCLLYIVFGVAVAIVAAYEIRTA